MNAAMRTMPRVLMLVTFVLLIVVANACKSRVADEEDHGQTAAPEVSEAMPGDLGTAASGGSRTPSAPESTAGAQLLSGRDVYRLNCQACHGPDAKGTTQTPSLLPTAQTLARGDGDSTVRSRLAKGGERMPALAHLSPPEVDAILGYLRELGGAGPTPGVEVVALSGPALGERIYQSNCASCHEPGSAAAAGLMCQPAPLAGATQRFSKEQVMNLLDVGVGPMPAFAHLNQDERDALWLYLETRPSIAGARPTMGERCPMVRAAMEGRPMGSMRGPGMRGGGPMGMGMGRHRGGGMMGQGMGCPMMGTSAAGNGRAPSTNGAPQRLRPCCR